MSIFLLNFLVLPPWFSKISHSLNAFLHSILFWCHHLFSPYGNWTFLLLVFHCLLSMYSFFFFFIVLFFIFHVRGFPHQSVVHSYVRLQRLKADWMLLCEKAELTDWGSSFRRVLFRPRHVVKAWVKCQYLWRFSLGQIDFPERNCAPACVATFQLFQPSREKELGESHYSTYGFHWVPMLSMPGVLKFITLVIQYLQSINFQHSAKIKRDSLLATEPWRTESNFSLCRFSTNPSVFAPILCCLSEVYAVAFNF